MTVGPYIVDEKLNRVDVRGDRTEAELQLTLCVFTMSTGAGSIWVKFAASR